MSATVVDPGAFDSLQRAADRAGAVLAELATQTVDITGDMFGSMDGAAVLMAAVREFDETLRRELSTGAEIIQGLDGQFKYVLQDIQGTDNTNANGVR